MGPERLSKIMTCERYFNNFRSTFNDDNFVQRTNKINKSSTDSEKEFGKFFHNVIQCYIANISERNVETYTRELQISQETERWTDVLIDLLSPHYDNKTSDSFLNPGGAENMERYLNHFSEIYHQYKLNQFSWECELEIRGFEFDCFSLNGDIDLVGINEGEKRIFTIELKKAQKPYPQWKYQLYLYMLMLQEKYQDYTIFGAIWHPGAKLKAIKIDAAKSFIDSILDGNETNPISYICGDCTVYTCEDRK